MKNKMVNGRPLLSAAIMVAALFAFAPSAQAYAPDADDAMIELSAPRLSDAEMDTMRGGFFDPTGLIFRFAVDVQTHIDGMVEFVRSIVMMPDIKGNLVASAQADLQTVELPAGTTASMVSGGRGVVVTDEKGTTTALNQTTQGALANIIMNTADNREITQKMDINIVLKGVESTTSHIRETGGHSVNGLGNMLNMHSIGFGL